LNDPAISFKGAGQAFQRGWIFVAQGGGTQGEIAIVRGFGAWFVWTSNMADDFLINAAPDEPSSAVALIGRWPAPLPLSGTTRIYRETATTIALQRCDTASLLGYLGCHPLLPELKTTNGPFDFAAHLDIPLLASPSSEGRQKRIDAAFTDWLPCYTRSPELDREPGEDTAGNANVMLRGERSCPLRAMPPRDAVRTWLSAFDIPNDLLPGSSISRTKAYGILFCDERKGELDVLLVQLIALRFQYVNELAGAPLTKLDTAMSPWGGSYGEKLVTA
jgi:hypothetical protein